MFPSRPRKQYFEHKDKVANLGRCYTYTFHIPHRTLLSTYEPILHLELKCFSSLRYNKKTSLHQLFDVSCNVIRKIIAPQFLLWDAKVSAYVEPRWKLHGTPRIQEVKQVKPDLKQHGAHNVELLLLDPWQCTFLLPNLPNPHQDACDQLCPTILKIYVSTDVQHHVDAYPHMHIFCTASSPFTNLLLLCPETASCPQAAAQATTKAAAATAAAADQAADHCKAFPQPLRAGFWQAAILTRSERGPKSNFGRLTP